MRFSSSHNKRVNKCLHSVRSRQIVPRLKTIMPRFHVSTQYNTKCYPKACHDFMLLCHNFCCYKPPNRWFKIVSRLYFPNHSTILLKHKHQILNQNSTYGNNSTSKNKFGLTSKHLFNLTFCFWWNIFGFLLKIIFQNQFI